MAPVLEKKVATRYLEELFGQGWFDLFEPFLLSEGFRKVMLDYHNELAAGRALTPRFPDLFRPFQLCSRTQIHTLILTAGPYAGTNSRGDLLADGLAFSAKHAQVVPKELDHVFDAIDTMVAKRFKSSKFMETTDLSYWARQGILLLNCSFTTYIGGVGIGTHASLWESFLNYVLRRINDDRDNLGIVLIGENAKGKGSILTNPTYRIFSCEHMMLANGRANGRWHHEGVFGKLTEYQKSIGNIIKW